MEYFITFGKQVPNLVHVKLFKKKKKLKQSPVKVSAVVLNWVQEHFKLHNSKSAGEYCHWSV